MIYYIIYIISIINILIAQGQYQIIQLPNNTLDLISNQSTLIINNANIKKVNSNFSTTLISYPANINFCNFQMKQFSISVLNYGVLEDQVNNDVLKTFSANEYYLQYLINKKINNNINLYYSIGTAYSQIYNYHSLLVASSLKIKKYFPKYKFHISAGINNAGFIIKEYRQANTKLPIEYQLGIGYYFQNISIGYDLIYHYQDNHITDIICLKINIINNINLILSNTNHLKKLSSENDLNYLLGFSGGIDFVVNNTNINMGFLNLGPAGMSSAITINYKLF